MPRLKETKTERFNRVFSEVFRVGKARANMTNQEIASLIGLSSQAALKRRRDNPSSFTLKELMTIGTAFRWSEEEYATVINAMR